MYLVDANILVYATDEDSDHHAAARDWLDERTSGAPMSVGLPWPSLLAFFRLVTQPAHILTSCDGSGCVAAY